MSRLTLIKAGLLIVMIAAVVIYAKNRDRKDLVRALLAAFGIYSVIQIGLLLVLSINHSTYPMQLETMELTVLTHLKRLMAGQPVYPPPGPDFVALAYNPLYYFVSAPFAAVFGQHLFALRLVAILAMSGIGAIIFLAVRRNTSSWWWALLAAGLFAAAYRTMDTYLDNGHSDSLMLFLALLGFFLIDLKRGRSWNLLAVFILAMSFFAKQHGAIFAIGGVLFLTWQEGLRNWRRYLPYWVVAGLFGPGLYALAGLVLGPNFFYFTFQVPRQWTEFRFDTIIRYATIIITDYPILAALGIAVASYTAIKTRLKINVWYFVLPFAMATGFLGALDPGSADNVFIGMGIFYIITGMLALKWLADRYELITRRGLHLAAIGLTFVIFLYDPFPVFVSRAAPAAYQDLVSYLKSLDGPVYAPWFGQLDSPDYQLSPAAHWVPLEDMIRGPGRTDENNPIIRQMLDPLVHPTGKAYLLMYIPLDKDPMLRFLKESYVLDTDLENRFTDALKTLPKRFVIEGPRYLYRYDPVAAKAANTN